MEEIKSLKDREKELLEVGKKQGYITYEVLAEHLKGLDIDADSLDEFPEFFESERDPDEPEEGDEIIVDDSEEFSDHYTPRIYHKPEPEEDNSDEMYDDEEDEDLEEFERNPLPYLTDIINMEMRLDKSQKVFEKMVEESLKNEMEEEEDE